jgi:phage terminase Nu1 subunit (DNA packaging protein)
VQETVTAEGLAHLFGVSAKTVRALARRGIVAKAGRNLFTLDDSIRNYCGHLRELAHGRKEGDGPASERARLAVIFRSNERTRARKAGVIEDVHAAFKVVAAVVYVEHDFAVVGTRIRA